MPTLKFSKEESKVHENKGTYIKGLEAAIEYVKYFI
jgi:hypothetical protein